MKKCKKIITTIILIILAILTVVMVAFSFFSGTSEANTSDTDFPTTIQLKVLEDYGSKVWSPTYKEYRYDISGNQTLLGVDAYCVQQGQCTYDGLGDNYENYETWQLRHTVEEVVKIKGNIAQWYSIKNEQYKFEATKINGKWCELEDNGNALLAAIICATETPSGVELELGCGDDPAYRESQVAIYDYWDEWLSKVNSALASKGFSTELGGGGGNASFVSPYMSDYKTLASQNIYEVTIVFLKHTTNAGIEMLQRIIFVDREEPEPKNIDIPVQKVWLDGEYTSRRPSSITVALYKNGTQIDTITLDGVVDDIETSPWYAEFKDLPQTDDSGATIQYEVGETLVPMHYHCDVVQNKDEDGSWDITKGFLIKNRLKTKVTVKKVWEDVNNLAGLRPDSLTIKLYCNGDPVKQGGTEQKTVILNESNNWTATFDYNIGNGGLGKYDWDGNLYVYTVKEDENGIPEEYEVEYSDIETDEYGNTTITITNKAVTDVTIQKKWEDNNNSEGKRPTSITVELYKNGEATGNKITLDGVVDSIETSAWTAKFDNLDRYDSNGEIEYTVVEETIENYITTYEKNKDERTSNVSIIITNTLEYKGYIEITGKVWEDLKDGKDNRYNGVYDYSQVEGEHSEKGLEGIRVILKDKDGKPFKSTYYSGNRENENLQFIGTDYAITNSDGTYTIRVNYDNSYNVYKLYEDADVVKEKLKEAYVEFEYDGFEYTTVTTASTGVNTSKARESIGRRTELDETYSKIEATTTKRADLEYDDKKITATTEEIITSFNEYEHKEEDKDEVKVRDCDGTNYQQTNIKGAWLDIITEHTHSDCPMSYLYEVDLTKIKNVNLGLMRRERPDLEIKEELSTVEINMNEQSYIYDYRSVAEVEEGNGVQVQFQKGLETINGVYAYRRPVNPSNIADLANGQGTAGVFVTYKVTITNTAETLISTVHTISNYFDKHYKLENITIVDIDGDGNEDEEGDSEELAKPEAKDIIDTGFCQKTMIDLNKQLGHNEKCKIKLKYNVDIDAIKALLKNDATLSNAVEIESYSTYYGEGTLYAERISPDQESERAGDEYGEYDRDSHPGNAGIRSEVGKFTFKVNDEIVATYEDEEILIADVPEDDTAIAPSFLLCKDETPKTLSGTVFEDSDAITTDEERLGDGKYDSATENKVQNVKVELYEVGSREVAELYEYNDNGTIKTNTDGTPISPSVPAIQYTNSEGNYAFKGVVTGKEYYLKFTYGDDKAVLTEATKIIDPDNANLPAVNARNYKSTIIADNVTLRGVMQGTITNKRWYLEIGDNYSVALDNMKDRLEIDDLQYSNFHKEGDNTYIEPKNMSAYTKSFEIPVEFDTIGEDTVESILGSIDNASNDFSQLNFGIVERPREDLFVEKTISYIKITLANGQKLIEGDPRDKENSINYVKAMGFDDITESWQARNLRNKRLLAEIDAELIQGAQLDLSYEVTVTNHNEIDYDYEGSYGDIVKSSENGEYITKQPEAWYYYYGDKTHVSDDKILKTTIQLVDYLSSNIVYEGNEDWTEAGEKTLYDSGLISEDARNAAKDNYIVLQPTVGTITLARGATTDPLKMTTRKMLTSQSINGYKNDIEIIQIDGKTARTIQAIDGKIVEKTYLPGNHVPGLSELEEQDDDGTEAIIAPPTGTKFVITYVIAGLVGLMVIAIGATIIKKKILTK